MCQRLFQIRRTTGPAAVLTRDVMMLSFLQGDFEEALIRFLIVGVYAKVSLISKLPRVMSSAKHRAPEIFLLDVSHILLQPV